MGLIPLTSLDEAWLLDSPLNKCQPVCYVTCEKMSARDMKRLIMQRLVANTTRMQCCLTKFLGSVFMKKLPMNEIQQAVEIIEKDSGHSLHTEQDLGDFLAKEINIPISFDDVQWKMWIVEDYSDDEIAILFKEHHVMADGIGILEIIMLMTDEFKPEAMIDFRPTSWFNQMLLYLISPFFILYYLMPILFKRRDKFSITNVRFRFLDNVIF